MRKLKRTGMCSISKKILAAEAVKLRDRIIKLKEDVATSSFELGMILKRVKDEKLYRALDHDTFNEFLGDPQYGMARSTAYLFMGLYERYVDRLKIPNEKLVAIGTTRLQLIGPVVSNTLDKPTEEWLDKAEHLSFSDLKIEVDEALGRPDRPGTASVSSPEARSEAFEGGGATPLGGKYLAYAKARPCVLHPNREADLHHFPRTRGARADDWKVIPLCRPCHLEYHQDPKGFTWANRIKLLDFYYELIYKLYEERQ